MAGPVDRQKTEKNHAMPEVPPRKSGRFQRLLQPPRHAGAVWRAWRPIAATVVNGAVCGALGLAIKQNRFFLNL